MSAAGWLDPGASGTRRGALREAAAALLVQACVLALFFATPLTRYGEVHYTSADLTQVMSLTQVVPEHRPGNQLLSDGVTQMQPWLLFDREELRQGRFPLWNPRNGTGTPQFANYQSAVLSPFSVPFYVLSFKAALLVSAALKLAALGFLTYLFLRRLGCGWIAATAGGIAFEFAGHNVVLLGFPHVAALATLPAGLFFAESALRRVELGLERDERPRLTMPLVGVCASFAIGLLAGNPEPFYFAALAVGAWTLVRIARLALRFRASGRRRLELLRVAALLAFAILLGAGLAAVQVLPFLDYLQRSLVLQERSLTQTPLELRWWPLLLFPDVLGNPSSIYNLAETIPPPNYELVNMGYVGGAALVLAGLCPFVARRRRGGLFFPLAAVFWFLYAHDVGGLARLLAHLPTVDMAPMNRSQGVWCFLVACSAAIALEALLARPPRRAPQLAGWTLAASAAGIVACLLGAERLIDEFATVQSPNHVHFAAYVPAHLGAMSAWTGVAALACATMLLVRERNARGVAALTVGAAFFAQTGWHLRDYNPVSADAFVFPRTESIERLVDLVGDERLAVLGQDSLPPDSNLVYGLNLLESYDGMWVRELDRLYRDRFGNGDNWRPILRGTAGGLRLFATRWVLGKWGWNFLDAGMRNHPRNPMLRPERLALGPQRDAVQTFRCEEEGLSRVVAWLSTQPGGRDCTLRMRLEELESGRVVSEQARTSVEVRASLYSRTHVTWPGEPQLSPAGRPVVFRFEPEPHSARKSYRLTLSCVDGEGDDTVLAWHMPKRGYGKGESSYGGRALPGELLFDWSCGEEERFEEVASIGDFTLWRLRDALAPYQLVDDALVVPDREAELELLRCASFDPRRVLVLGPPDEARHAELARAREAMRQRTIVQFADADHCYLASLDGTRLARIDDEATFVANGFDWRQIQRLPAAERERFEVLADDERAAKRELGLRLLEPVHAPRGTLALVEQTPTQARLRVEREQPGYLLVANAYDPGWRARVDGERVPVLRANHAFQALALPAGTHEVELEYWPEALTLGLWVSAASAATGLLALVLARFARRRHVPRAA